MCLKSWKNGLNSYERGKTLNKQILQGIKFHRITLTQEDVVNVSAIPMMGISHRVHAISNNNSIYKVALLTLETLSCVFWTCMC